MKQLKAIKTAEKKAAAPDPISPEEYEKTAAAISSEFRKLNREQLTRITELTDEITKIASETLYINAAANEVLAKLHAAAAKSAGEQNSPQLMRINEPGAEIYGRLLASFAIYR